MIAHVEISENRIADLLCSAFEGGSNYWYVIEGFIAPKMVDLFPWDNTPTDKHVYRQIQYPIRSASASLSVRCRSSPTSTNFKRLAVLDPEMMHARRKDLLSRESHLSLIRAND
jgi:hypothetical protein